MLKQMWWYLMVRGVIALVLGAFALFSPTMSLSVLIMVVGIFCAADGVITLLFAMRASELKEYLIQGAISLIIGLVLIFWPEGTLRILLILFGLWLAFIGISQILTARRLDAEDSNRALLMTLGILVAAIGGVLVFWPGSGIVVISWVIAFAALFYGIMSIYLGSRFRKLGKTVASAGGGQ